MSICVQSTVDITRLAKSAAARFARIRFIKLRMGALPAIAISTSALPARPAAVIVVNNGQKTATSVSVKPGVDSFGNLVAFKQSELLWQVRFAKSSEPTSLAILCDCKD